MSALSYSAEQYAERARAALRYYFGLAAGEAFSGECNAEIGEIVDAIIDAATLQVRAEREEAQP